MLDSAVRSPSSISCSCTFLVAVIPVRFPAACLWKRSKHSSYMVLQARHVQNCLNYHSKQQAACGKEPFSVLS